MPEPTSQPRQMTTSNQRYPQNRTAKARAAPMFNTTPEKQTPTKNQRRSQGAAPAFNMTTPEKQTATNKQRRSQGKVQPQAKVQAPATESTAEEAEAEVQRQAYEMGQVLLAELSHPDPVRQQSATINFVDMAYASTLSSRAAQSALENTSSEEQVKLVNGLRGQVLKAMQNPNANHVISKMVQVMPCDRVSFIVEELKGYASTLSRHRYGCRLLCRIIEHLSPRDVAALELLAEVLTDAEELCTHAFGIFVVCHILEYGLPEHKATMAAVLGTNLMGFAVHKKGRCVVEAAFRHLSAEEQRALANDLLSDSTQSKGQLLALAQSQFGRHVVVAMMDQKSEVRMEAIQALVPLADQLAPSAQFVHKALMSHCKPRRT